MAAVFFFTFTYFSFVSPSEFAYVYWIMWREFKFSAYLFVCVFYIVAFEKKNSKWQMYIAESQKKSERVFHFNITGNFYSRFVPKNKKKHSHTQHSLEQPFVLFLPETQSYKTKRRERERANGREKSGKKKKFRPFAHTTEHSAWILIFLDITTKFVSEKRKKKKRKVIYLLFVLFVVCFALQTIVSMYLKCFSVIFCFVLLLLLLLG